MPINVATYNCQNIQTSQDEIRELCRGHDIILLQETWLLETDLGILLDIDSNFHAKGLSSMNIQDGLLTGRPYGGLAVLWSKKLGNQCKPVIYGDDTRVMSLELTISSVKYLFLNVYMPYCCADNYDIFLANLAKIESTIRTSDTPYIFAIGDFNADPTSDHLFGRELAQYSQDSNLIIADILHLKNIYTFYSCAHNTTSWLDHALCTPSAAQLVQSCRVYFDKISSDHFPLSITININRDQNVQEENIPSPGHKYRIYWDKLTTEQFQKYASDTERYLNSIKFNKPLSSCEDYRCQLHDHLVNIDKLYEDICEVLHRASQDLVDRRASKPHQLPGWNDFCQDSHARAREAFLLWRRHGSPKQGPLFETMKGTRSCFKLSLRQCKRAKDQKTTDILAEKFVNKDSKSLWKNIRRTYGKDNQGYSTNIAGATGPRDICNMWRCHYRDLLNSTSDSSKKNDVLKRLQDISACEEILPSDIKTAIRSLKRDTSPGKDDLFSEHFIFASDKICLYLSILFNSMIVHNYLPQKFMDSLIIPLLKNNKCDLTNCDNYRPISITCIMSKILEIVILSKYSMYFFSSDHQFGFKSKHSTDQCIFILKELIDLYLSTNSPLYVCFMDASKAFDRIQHSLLFKKLLARGIPVAIVRLLYTWYSSQDLFVKWCNIVSEPFKMTNGLRQGGNLSPVLFNLYTSCI